MPPAAGRCPSLPSPAPAAPGGRSRGEGGKSPGLSPGRGRRGVNGLSAGGTLRAEPSCPSRCLPGGRGRCPRVPLGAAPGRGRLGSRGPSRGPSEMPRFVPRCLEERNDSSFPFISWAVVMADVTRNTETTALPEALLVPASRCQCCTFRKSCGC